jgi:hypothetical protein
MLDDGESKEKRMIRPTVGRVVLYHKDKEHDGRIAGGIDGTLAAIVCHVWSDRCVNLAVLDAEGQFFGRTSVTFWQGDTERPEGRYCEWMPYQLGQAAKTEQFEEELKKSRREAVNG